MTLFSGRILLLLLFIITGFGWALGVIHWNSDKVKCLEPKHWTGTRWYTFMSVGKVEIRYRNWNWDCDTKYDPKEMQKGIDYTKINSFQ